MSLSAVIQPLAIIFQDLSSFPSLQLEVDPGFPRFYINTETVEYEKLEATVDVTYAIYDLF